MNIQINGFDIEINTEDTTLTLKVTDASGKELSNNTFTQETAETSVQPAQMTSVQDSTIEEPTTDESLIPTLESIKKSK